MIGDFEQQTCYKDMLNLTFSDTTNKIIYKSTHTYLIFFSILWIEHLKHVAPHFSSGFKALYCV